MKKVGLIMGSDSDLPVVKKAAGVLDELGIPYEAHVYSAHRTPAEARAWSLSAREEGFGVVIAFAGMAAHLAGAIAANTNAHQRSLLKILRRRMDDKPCFLKRSESSMCFLFLPL